VGKGQEREESKPVQGFERRDAHSKTSTCGSMAAAVNLPVGFCT